MKSPLVWTGGKHKLQPLLTKRIYSVGFERYFEPFCGGAQVYLGLETSKSCFLSDALQMPIVVYKEIKNQPNKFFAEWIEHSERLWEKGAREYGFY